MNVLELAEQDTSLQRVSVREYAGPCPGAGCSGRDRFHVNLDKCNGEGGWMCRTCWQAEEKGWGDCIAYLRHFRGLSFAEAKAEVAGDDFETAIRVATPTPMTNGMPGASWQRWAQAYVEACQRRLPGSPVLDYLHNRGLADRTIHAAKLGYDPESERPLIIPCMTGDGGYWRITRRALDLGVEPRYMDAKGSSKEGLYGGELLRLKRPVFLVESDLDALTIVQEASDLVVAVSTGSTMGARSVTWMGKLALASHVFVAFDADAKGEEAARYWLTRLAHNGKRWRPLAKDANAMLSSGLNIRAWVQDALESLVQPDDLAEADQFAAYAGMANAAFMMAADAEEQALEAGNAEKAAALHTIIMETLIPASDMLDEAASAAIETVAKRKRVPCPKWLIPGTWDWEKQVNRSGLQDMLERRRAWLDEQKAG